MMTRLTASAAGALAFALLSGAAPAAELLSAEPIAIQAGYGSLGVSDKWTGFYAGIHGGLVNGAGMVTLGGKSNTWEGGVHLGGNAQLGALVLGAELEGNYAAGLRYDLGSGAGFEQHWSGAAKLRGGLAIDSLLLYGTVGYGFARLEPDGTVTSDAKYVGGLTFGGGAEFAVTEDFSLRLDYTQSRFDNVAYTAGGVSQAKDLVSHAVRAGISFQF